MPIARYPFTCCNWSTLSELDRTMLIELVNAAGDRLAAERGHSQAGYVAIPDLEVVKERLQAGSEVGDTVFEDDRGASQQRALARVRERARARAKSRTK